MPPRRQESSRTRNGRSDRSRAREADGPPGRSFIHPDRSADKDARRAYNRSRRGREVGQIQGADRKNEGDFLGVAGIFKSLYFEVGPSILGFIAIAVVRLVFVTKEAFSVANLFSGLKEMFQNIKQSFKSPE